MKKFTTLFLTIVPLLGADMHVPPEGKLQRVKPWNPEHNSVDLARRAVNAAGSNVLGYINQSLKGIVVAQYAQALTKGQNPDNRITRLGTSCAAENPIRT